MKTRASSASCYHGGGVSFYLFQSQSLSLAFTLTCCNNLNLPHQSQAHSLNWVTKKMSSPQVFLSESTYNSKLSKESDQLLKVSLGFYFSRMQIIDQTQLPLGFYFVTIFKLLVLLNPLNFCPRQLVGSQKGAISPFSSW